MFLLDIHSISHTLTFSRCLLLSFLAAFALRTRLTLLNKRNQEKMAALSPDEKQKLENKESAEIWDNDPRYVFMTWDNLFGLDDVHESNRDYLENFGNINSWKYSIKQSSILWGWISWNYWNKLFGSACIPRCMLSQFEVVNVTSESPLCNADAGSTDNSNK